MVLVAYSGGTRLIQYNESLQALSLVVLTIIILFMFDPFPVSWTRTPETLQIYSLS